MQSTTYIKIVALFFFSICLSAAFSQTISWSGYPAGSIGSYNSGTAPNNMTAVVTINNVTQNDGTPKYTAGTASPTCYIAGLALNAGTFSSYKSSANSNYTVTMTFNPTNVGSINGTCNSATFSIRDINSEETYTTFLDVIEISAIDGNGAAIATGSITTTLASNITRVNTGATVRLVGHSSSNETTGSYSGGQNCGDTKIIITPSANTPLKSITIKYRPGYGTSTSNAYYNLDPKPAIQFVSISDIVLNSVGVCPVPLAIRLGEFNAKRFGTDVSLDWTSISEQNNDYFTIEESTDGVNYKEVTRMSGVGNSNSEKHYNYLHANTSSQETYYRLFQTDFDGKRNYLDTKVVPGLLKDNLTITDIYPNPAKDIVNIVVSSNELSTARLQIVDVLGKVVTLEDDIRILPGENKIQVNTSSLQKGFYFLKVESDSKSESDLIKFLID